ncbi:M48 family metalloprotease [Ruegeria sp. PrR005]|uniref:M48 family metalloprotease n=1 Tax=Ruegeria sp. PrR005 TaxID=2706882 RepID=A0A6B2NUW1_9RHOB|nr:M48 family metalloprotease [Ruegeria sp. PrR005]NDW47952.1 M48 family metalloprotease [Ruegeria sp. PrR005]
MRRLLLLIALVLSACDAPAPTSAPVPLAPVPSGPAMSPASAQAAFSRVSASLRPVAVNECQRRTSGMRCDFQIEVDPNPRAPVNAYQTVDKDGRPVIIFTRAMINSARNPDELAFVMGHEAAHHIRGHLARQQANAAAGAIVFAGLAGLTGGNASAIDAATQVGALVGSRTYSKDYELEADELGTLITYRAGYNPLIGAHFFSRIPDPGDRFLGTHPPNASRIQVVQRTAANLGLVQ